MKRASSAGRVSRGTDARRPAILVRSFAPVAGDDATTLILGSMPGEASLAAGQYYAHPRNAFWSILGEIVGFDAAAPYELRLAALRSGRFALWDVLQSCHREGSLDASIALESEVANDFGAFFDSHPRIDRVLFNGAKAESSYLREVAPGMAGRFLDYRRLPSTSPANASWSRTRKLDTWREAVDVRR